MISVGVDVAEATKGLDLVALDGGPLIVHSAGRLTLNEVANLVGELQPDIVCIDSPSGWARVGRSRAAERELRRFGLSAFATPTDPGDHPFYRWMRVGFSIYRVLSDRYPLFRGEDPEGTAAEVFPEATSVLLAKRFRTPAETKTTFRRLVLRGQGLQDAEQLPNLDRVDAALAALTGLYALEGDYSSVGVANEGVILLPGSELPERAYRRVTSQLRALSEPTPAASGDGLCLCGCGAPVRRRFLPGHDARLRSRLERASRAGDSDARIRLRELGWLALDSTD